METKDQIVLPPPDDFHLHVRDGAVMASVIPDAARRFQRAIIMPNLVPPITTTDMALAYRERILQVSQRVNPKFQPLMTLYLTDQTTPDEIVRAKNSGVVFAVKLYPAGATTNSDSGVTNIQNVMETLRRMSELGMPLLVHGEVTDASIDIFDRECVFIERVLRPLVNSVPNLKIVMEHITTKSAVEFVSAGGPNLAATITAHHLLFNRNIIFKGGINPHYYCLPVLKTENDRRALLEAATSGSPKFFLGTDSAPHPRSRKESCCGSAGCFTSFAAIELYAEAFESVGALDKLKGFACEFGAQFYGLPLNSEAQLRLVKQAWKVPDALPLGDDQVVPLKASGEISWRLDGQGLGVSESH